MTDALVAAGETEVHFESTSLRLVGTFTLPAAPSPPPAVLLIPGSGMVDRDENARRMPFNVLREFAAHLAKQGIASLRYDKRGIGASGGDFFETGFEDNVADARAALTYLQTQGVDPLNTFVIGHSEGALIATRLAAMQSPIAGIVLLSGTASSGREVVLAQGRRYMQDVGWLIKWLMRLFRYDPLRAQERRLDEIAASSASWYRTRRRRKVNAKWLREFIAYDPAADMPAITVPVLALTGAKDIQVDPLDLGKMAGLINSSFERAEIADLTHILRRDPAEPKLGGYKQQVSQPVDPEVLNLVTDWLRRHIVQP